MLNWIKYYYNLNIIAFIYNLMFNHDIDDLI